MSRATRRRRSKRIRETEQANFGFAGCIGPRAAVPGEVRAERRAEFLDPDPKSLSVGQLPLAEYLKTNGFEWVLKLREVVRQLDSAPMTRMYKGVGRKPFHPAAMVGLILFCLMRGTRSLRAMAETARVDVRAWWLTGGLLPDHSTLGYFIERHSDFLTDDFFVETTKHLLACLDRGPGIGAFDGTTVEAAGSHWKMIRREAALLAAEEAAKAAAASPGDEKAKAKAEAAAVVADTIEERVQKRKEMGKSDGAVRITPSEPEAVVQPIKSGAIRPSYKPSAGANEDRMIVAAEVVGSDEPSAVKPMLAQYERICGAPVRTALLDAGYHDIETLRLCVEAELDVLCPSGTARGKNDFKRYAKGAFDKSRFTYDEAADRYICPLGKPLKRLQAGSERHGLKHVRYLGVECGQCSRRTECTKAKARQIKRYEGEELKEAADLALAHPRAREVYRLRRQMIEPVFAELKERQGLHRFTRRGLRKVTLEFRLHCVAYNIKRAFGIKQRRLLAVCVEIRLPGEGWRTVWCAVALW